MPQTKHQILGLWEWKLGIQSLKFLVRYEKKTCQWYKILLIYECMGFLVFLGGSDGKNLLAMKENWDLIPGSGSSPGKGNGYPFQYSCLKSSMDRRVWHATVHVVTKNQTRLSNQY